MKNAKRIIATILVVATLMTLTAVTLTGCGNTKNTAKETTAPTDKPATVDQVDTDAKTYEGIDETKAFEVAGFDFVTPEHSNFVYSAKDGEISKVVKVSEDSSNIFFKTEDKDYVNNYKNELMAENYKTVTSDSNPYKDAMFCFMDDKISTVYFTDGVYSYSISYATHASVDAVLSDMSYIYVNN